MRPSEHLPLEDRLTALVLHHHNLPPALSDLVEHLDVIGLHELRTKQFYEFAQVATYGELVTIGRNELCRICLEDDTVSKLHCSLLRQQDGSWLLEDQGSRNGTYLDGQRVSRVVLAPGQWLRVGNTEFCAVGPDRRVSIRATTLTTFYGIGHMVYGSAEAAARMIDKSASTVRRHAKRWLGRKGAK